MTALDELAMLGAFYGVDVAPIARTHGAALATYAEWVLARDAFALVTLGEPVTLATLASPTAGARLLRAAARWPGAIAGIKLAPARDEEPTLYLRPLCPWSDGIEWLACEVGVAATRIPPARTLYGLGFQGELVKTYALAPDGFVSYRVTTGELCGEHKEYRADVAWDAIEWPDARWVAIGALGRSLGFQVAGHVGDTTAGERKVYVERIGGIATDRSLA